MRVGALQAALRSVPGMVTRYAIHKKLSFPGRAASHNGLIAAATKPAVDGVNKQYSLDKANTPKLTRQYAWWQQKNLRLINAF